MGRISCYTQHHCGKDAAYSDTLPPWLRPIGAALLSLWPFSRHCLFTLVRRIGGGDEANEKQVMWKDVWQPLHSWRQCNYWE